MKTIYLLVFFFLHITIFAQTGPGGVGNASSNVIWLDANAQDLNDSSAVFVLKDKSGNSNHAFQTVTVNQPICYCNMMNGKPVIRFDGENDYLQTAAISALNTSQQTWFSVQKSNAGTTTRYIWANNYSSGVTTGSDLLCGNYATSNTYNVFSRASTGTLKTVPLTGVSSLDFISTVWSTPSAGTLTAYKNGTAGTIQTGVSAFPFGHNYTRIGASSSSLSSFFRGELAELIFFNIDLNTTQRKIIENYLSSKYNRSFANTSNNLYSWDSPGTFENEVAGIGRTSVTDEHLRARGTGIVEFSNPTSIPDGGFILFGHNNNSLTTIDTSLPSTYDIRLERVWRVQKTGNFSSQSTITVSFDLTDLEFGNPLDYVLLIDSDGDFVSSATEHTTGMNFDNATKILTFTGVYFNNGDYFTLGNKGNIKSISSGLWNDITTWDCNCIPTNSNNVEILFGHHVQLNGIGNAKNLKINSIGMLTINPGRILRLKADLINEGALHATTGKVIFNGSSSQTISSLTPVSFYDLTLANQNGLTLNGAIVNIKNNLSISKGTLNTNNLLTIVSDSLNTGRISQIWSNANISGNVTVQRYLPGSDNSWRMIAAPVANDIIQSWRDHFPMSGFPGADSVLPPPDADSTFEPFVSVHYFNETLSGDFDDRYVPPSSTSEQIVPGRGYFAYIGGAGGVYPSFTIDVHGNILKGPVNLNITNSNNGEIAGFNLIANPFASPVYFNNLENLSITSNEYWVFDPELGNYRYWQGEPVNSGNAGASIASSQAFWVFKNDPGAGTLTFPESSKDSLTSFPVLRSSNPQEKLILLSVSSDLNKYGDEIFIRFDNNALAEFDVFDQKKFNSPNNLAPDLFTFSTDNQRLSVNSLPEQGTTISLNLDVKVSGVYSIKVNELSIPESSCLMLEDLFTNSFTDLRINNSYSFSATTSDTSARFLLHIGAPVWKNSENISCFNGNDGLAIVSGNGTGPWNYIWLSENNDTIKASTSYTPDSLVNIAAGIYKVKIISAGAMCTELSETFNITEPAAMEFLSEISNPLCFGSADGKINITVLGGTEPFSYSWNNGSSDKILNNLLSGNYQLTITDNNSCTISSSFILQDDTELIAGFEVDKDSIFLPGTDTIVHFTNNSSGMNSFIWSSGDSSGTISTEMNPQFSYNTPGTYYPNIKVYNSDGDCIDSAGVAISVLLQTSINASQPSSGISIFSIQNGAEINFDLLYIQKIEISVYNLLGQKITDDVHLEIKEGKKTVLFPVNVSEINLITVKTETVSVTQKVFNSTKLK